MATRGQLLARIYDELGYTNTSAVSYAVTEAVKHHQARRFWFSESSRAVTFTATSVYVLNTILPGVIAIDSIAVHSGNARYELLYVSPQQFEYRFSSASTGKPYQYTTYNQRLLVYPTPASGSTYTASVNYHSALTLTESNSASNAWTNEAVELIKTHAKAVVLVNDLQNPDAAAKLAEYGVAVLDRLVRQTISLRERSELEPFL